MRIAIVGNGPSAAGKGAEIDAHDKVVRCGVWGITAAPDTGRKLDAWAWFGAMGHPKNMGAYPAGNYEFWVTRAVNPQRPIIPEHATLLYNVIVATQGFRPLKVITEEHWTRANAYLKAQPTTGFLALHMAMLGYFGAIPDAVTVYGFDCTTPDKPGWEYGGRAHAGCPPILGPGDHDHPAEKKAILELVRKGTWLGNPVTIKATWSSMPEGLE